MRELLYLFAAVSFVLFAFTTYGLIPGAAATLLVGLACFVHGRKRERRFLAWAGVALFAPSVVTLSLGCAVWQLLGVGPVYFSSNYPDELKTISATMNVDASSAKVYCLHHFLDQEYVSRMKVQQQQFDRLATKPEYSSVPTDELMTYFWEAFPRSWRPPQDREYQCLTKDDETGYYLLAYDVDRGLLYVWYCFNF